MIWSEMQESCKQMHHSLPWLYQISLLDRAEKQFSHSLIKSFSLTFICVCNWTSRVPRAQLFPLSFDLGARWLDCPRQVAQLSIKRIEIRGARDSQAVYTQSSQERSIWERRAGKAITQMENSSFCSHAFCCIISMS
jgi:hypothetical protein